MYSWLRSAKYACAFHVTYLLYNGDDLERYRGRAVVSIGSNHKTCQENLKGKCP